MTYSPALDRRLTAPGLTITVAALVAVFIDHRPGQAPHCGTCHHRYTTATPLCPSAVLARQLLKHRQHEDRDAVEPIQAELNRSRDHRVLPDPEPERRVMVHPLLSAALGYAGRGWPVFLLGRTKRPLANCPACRDANDSHDRDACACLTCHGFYAATTDPDRIRAMVRAVPDGLLAIRTGQRSGLVVVDIDPRHGGQPDRALMTPTATVATGGGGWHLYYRHPGTSVSSRPLPDRAGVDIKADGGYVLAPPSVHPATKRPYRWVGGRPVDEMPPALATVCQPTPPVAATATTGPTPTRYGAGGISSPAALLAAHLDAIARAPVGRRRTTLYGAARGIARMVAAGTLTTADAWTALTAAGRAAEQTEREIRAAIAGGFRDEGVPA